MSSIYSNTYFEINQSIEPPWNIRRVFFWVNITAAFFWENIRNFSGIFVSWSMQKFLGLDFFNILGLGRKLQGYVWGNIRKAFFWENIRILLILELESFVSRNIKNLFRSGLFFVFLDLGWEIAQETPNYTTYFL